MPSAPAIATLRALAAETDRCVKCGLCLPHCPTYGHSRLEAESPRGRIAIAEHLATGAAPSRRMHERLDGCLGCRRCEAVCPAGVNYGQIIDGARELARPARTPDRLAMLSWAVLRRPALRRLARAGLRLAGRLGLLALLRMRRARGRWWRAAQLLTAPLPTERAPESNPDTPQAVHLFSPCASELMDPRTAADARGLARALGLELLHRDGTPCCGALAQHAGDRPAARRDQQQLLKHFDGDQRPIVCSGTGCSAMLQDHAQIHADGAAIAARSEDLCAWLARATADRQFQPLDATVALLVPCSQRNALRQADTVAELLRRIPGVRLVETGIGGRCCGAGGDQFLSHPDQADALVASHVASVRDAGADYVVTANVGCALHLGAALRREGLKVPVWHPVTLLRRQLAPGPGDRPAGSRPAAGSAPPTPPG